MQVDLVIEEYSSPRHDWTHTGKISVTEMGKKQTTGTPVSLHLLLEPTLKTFRWQIDRSQRLSEGLQRVRYVGGLFENDGQRLVGQFDERAESLSGLLYLCRPSQFAYSVKPLEQYGRGAGGKLSKFKNALASAPSLEEMNAWTVAYAEERNSEQMYKAGYLPRKAISMFASDEFRSTFGSEFRDLSNASLQKISRTLLEATYGRQNPHLNELSAVKKMFKPYGGESAIFTYLGVICHEAVLAWQEQASQNFASAAGTSEGWDGSTELLTHLSGERRNYLQYRMPPMDLVWPNRLEELKSAAHNCMKSSAIAKAESNLDELVEIKYASQRLKALSEWPGDEIRQAVGFGPGLRELGARRWEAIDRTLEELLVPLRQELAQIQKDGDGLDAGIVWLEKLRHNFGAHFRRGPIKSTIQDFQNLRKLQLEAAQPDLLAKIRRAKSRELNRIPSQYFPIPSDRATSVWVAVEGEIAKRRISLVDENRDLVAAAKEISKSNPELPLRFIDFSSYPAGHVYEYIYYGEGDPLDDVPESRKLSAGAGFDLTMRSIFITYHDEFLSRFGSNSAARKKLNNGREWAEITTVNTTVDGWGNVVSKGNEWHRSWVRPRFAKAYTACMPKEGDIWAGLFIKLIEDGQAKKVGDAAVSQKELFDYFLSPLERSLGVRTFLDDHGRSYPATVQHFEENLLRAITGREMIRIAMLEPEEIPK